MGISLRMSKIFRLSIVERRQLCFGNRNVPVFALVSIMSSCFVILLLLGLEALKYGATLVATRSIQTDPSQPFNYSLTGDMVPLQVASDFIIVHHVP